MSAKLKAQIAWCDAARAAAIALADDVYRIWTAYYRAGETPAAEQRMREELDAAKKAHTAAEIAADKKFQGAKK